MTTPTPGRVQLRRTKGYKKPADAVVITRATRWGNPYPVDAYGRDEAIARYRRDLRDGGVRNTATTRDFPTVTVDDIRRHFAGGQPVACVCAPDVACHGDVIRAVAAGEEP